MFSLKTKIFEYYLENVNLKCSRHRLECSLLPCSGLKVVLSLSAL